LNLTQPTPTTHAWSPRAAATATTTIKQPQSLEFRIQHQQLIAAVKLIVRQHCNYGSSAETQHSRQLAGNISQHNSSASLTIGSSNDADTAEAGTPQRQH
jgi:hypothetical protein